MSTYFLTKGVLIYLNPLLIVSLWLYPYFVFKSLACKILSRVIIIGKIVGIDRAIVISEAWFSLFYKKTSLI